jgi:hypothetical protein
VEILEEMKSGGVEPNQVGIQIFCFRAIGSNLYYTHKNAQVVTNLQQTCSNAVPTTCQQDVFALLVPSLLLSTTC